MSVRAAILALCAALLAAGWAPRPVPARDVGAELERIQQERQRLEEVRRELEAQLGTLGKRVRRLDRRLVAAKAARREVEREMAPVAEELAAVEEKRERLEKRVASMRERLMRAAVVAYERRGRAPGWLDLLRGIEPTEIPHRRFMFQAVAESQEAERRRYLDDVAELARLAQVRRERLDQLTGLRDARAAAEAKISESLEAKRALTEKVSRDLELKRRRARELARQEEQLRRLMRHLVSPLTEGDRAAVTPVRSRRGRLAWPLRGELVGRFGEQREQAGGRLRGVQLAPAERRRQVGSIAPGQVRYADWFGGYGLMMIVDHGDGIMSVYAHNDALFREVGDWVDEGEALAEAGSTGWVDGVVLYFEMRDAGTPVDPVAWCGKSAD